MLNWQLLYLFGQIRTSQTRGQLYSDTSPLFFGQVLKGSMAKSKVLLTWMRPKWRRLRHSVLCSSWYPWWSWLGPPCPVVRSWSSPWSSASPQLQKLSWKKRKKVAWIFVLIYFYFEMKLICSISGRYKWFDLIMFKLNYWNHAIFISMACSQ